MAVSPNASTGVSLTRTVAAAFSIAVQSCCVSSPPRRCLEESCGCSSEPDTNHAAIDDFSLSYEMIQIRVARALGTVKYG